MSLPTVVCPYDSRLLEKLTGYSIVVEVKSITDAAAAAEAVENSRNRLVCVIFKTADSLESITFPAELKEIPLAVFAASLGSFSNLAPQVKLLRTFNLRVYLPITNSDNITGLQILSSLGINGCAVFDRGPIDWDALTDLMVYAVLERTPHATIEPFSYIADNYNHQSQLDWGLLYFDVPQRIIHVDGDLQAQLLSAADPAALLQYKESADSWRAFFVDNHTCAACVGWKICMGRLAARLPEDSGCVNFFQETLESVRQYKSRNKATKESSLWLP